MSVSTLGSRRENSPRDSFQISNTCPILKASNQVIREGPRGFPQVTDIVLQLSYFSHDILAKLIVLRFDLGNLGVEGRNRGVDCVKSRNDDNEEA